MKEINYQKNLLIGKADSTTRDGSGYWVYVEPEDAGSEDDVLFREQTFISGTASTIRFGKRKSESIIDFLESMTFAKAKARITLGLYDRGREYKQEITTETMKSKLKPMEDEIIQKWILKGLLYTRKQNPIEYKHERFEIEGFCYLLGINNEQYLYNASILLEDGYVNEGIPESVCIKTGDFFITSLGIKQFSSISLRSPNALSIVENNDSSIIVNKTEFKYDIAISFAGEERKIAEKIAQELSKNSIKVFFDDFEKEVLWGKNLYDHLSYIYGKSARYCVMLLSNHYAEKTWTNHERKIAQARAFREKYEYILPIRIDNTEIPGLLETVGYISLNETSIEQIVELLILKLKSVS